MTRGDLLAALLLMLAVPCSAQTNAAAQVKGRVTDETGGALPGVTVARAQPGLLRHQLPDSGAQEAEWRVAVQPG